MANIYCDKPYYNISEQKNDESKCTCISNNKEKDFFFYNYQSLEDKNKLYQEEQCNYLMDKYLDIDVDDDILIISSACENNADYKFSFQILPKLIHKKYCLLKSIDTCEVKAKPHVPEDFFFSRVPLEEMFEFSFSGHPSKRYNKIIVKNCIQFFDKHQKYFCDLMKTLLKNTMPYVPCILIIQRVNNLSTLPFYKQVKYFQIYIYVLYRIYSKLIRRFTMNGPRQTQNILSLSKQ